MADIKLKIEDLALDHDNPRISHSEGQQEALQKVVKDQDKGKLVALATSIANHGLNPMDRLLVLRLNQRPARFIALEGNRRVAVFKMLDNPAVMSGLDIPAGMKRSFEALAKKFKRTRVEPIAAFEMDSREAARYWLDLRHNIGHEGAGIENWNTMAKRRFEGMPPALQVLDLVTERAGLSDAERAAITDKFPVSTLERFLDDKTIRKELGIDIKGGRVITHLPADEIAKPLKKIVMDLATKKVRVGRLMKTKDMQDYLAKDLGKAHLPDMSKVRKVERSLDEIPTAEFKKARAATSSSRSRRKSDPSDRKQVIPKNCQLNVTTNRLAEIHKELRTLKLDEAPNAIAVLLRAFLEMSVDHFLDGHGGSLKFTPPGSSRATWKPLNTKLSEVVTMLLNMGVPKNRFDAITRSINDKGSPMHIDLLHRYVHDPIQTPTANELKAAWNHAQPLFEHIWP